MGAAAIHMLLALSRVAADLFVAGLWQGAAMAVLVGLTLALVPRASSAARFAVWGLAFGLVLALPMLHVDERPSTVASNSVVHLGADCGVIIGGLWFALLVFRATQLSVQGVRLRRIWKGAQPVVATDEVLTLLHRCRRPAELCTSTDVDSPSVLGFFSPRLLIPEALFAALTPGELRHLVLHECEHLRRRDDWANLLQKVGLVLFPLNPALLWIDHRLSFERELACDAGVVAATAEPILYASCLTRVAEHRMERRPVALAMAALERKSQLARRVHSLLRKGEGRSRVQSRYAPLLLTLGLLGASMEMARAPRLVSFASAAAAAPVRDGSAVTGSHASFGARTVVYRAAKEPQPMLLNAVMPLAAPRHTGSYRKFTEGPHRNTGVRSLQRRSPGPTASLVLTSTKQQMPSSQTGLSRSSRHSVDPEAVFVPIEFSPAYAAVPFGDGWLIVQL